MAEDKKQKQSKKPDRLKPLSLYPLTPEQAMGAFMRVKPKKAALKARGTKKKEI